MTVERLHLPAAFLLCALTLTAWTHMVNGTRSGLSVVNHSGSVLRNVEVCLTSGDCEVRERLWPHEAWQLPEKAEDADVVKVRYEATGRGVRPPVRQEALLEVHRDGRVRLAQ